MAQFTDRYLCHEGVGVDGWGWGLFQERLWVRSSRLFNYHSSINYTSSNVCARYFMWNFKGTLWNSTQNTISIHWKMIFLDSVEHFRTLKFKSSQLMRFLKRTGLQLFKCCGSIWLLIGIGSIYTSHESNYHEKLWYWNAFHIIGPMWGNPLGPACSRQKGPLKHIVMFSFMLD